MTQKHYIYCIFPILYFSCAEEQSNDSGQHQWVSCYWWICQGNCHSQELQRSADIPQHFRCQQFWHFIIPPPLLISAAIDFFFLVCTCVFSSNAPSRLPCHPGLHSPGDDICKSVNNPAAWKDQSALLSVGLST